MHTRVYIYIYSLEAKLGDEGTPLLSGGQSGGGQKIRGKIEAMDARREWDRGRKGRSAVDTFVVAPATKVGVGGAGQYTLDVLFISKPYPFCASFVFLNF